MFSRFVKWLSELPEVIATWPGRLLEWGIESFWAFVEWLRDLPRKIKDGTIAVAIAFKELCVGIVFSIIRFFTTVFQRLASAGDRLVTPVVKFFRAKLEQDPSLISASKLKLNNRGRTVALFSRQLSSMTIGGVGILQSLDVLAEQADDPRMAYVSKELATKLGQGYSLSKATSEYPKIFPPVYYHLLRAGEGTGRLVEVISRLADLLEREEHLIKKVKSALSYPIFVLVLTAVMTLGMFSTVLPGFADFYDDFDVPLPALTAILMTLTGWVQTWWFWIFLVLGLIGTTKFIRHSWQILERRLVMFRALAWLPLVGPIIAQSCTARFCWVMELTQEAGLDVVRSVNLGCLASGSPILEIDAKRITHGITEGEHLSDLMYQRPDIYPHLLHQMVMMGEETSQNSESFGRAAGWFEQEVEARIESFQAALEPILMGLISLVVGVIVMAVFLPLYGLLDKLGV